MAWRDITESFKEACSKLPEETLVSNPHFNLFDCISAIPVSDKKMVNFEGFGCWSWRESESESERAQRACTRAWLPVQQSIDQMALLDY